MCSEERRLMSQADLKVSRCGRFAMLYNSKGVYCIVWSKPNAKFMVKTGVALKVIAPLDANKLLLQIDSSVLPEANELVSNESREVFYHFNVAHFDGFEVTEEEISRFLDLIERLQKTKLN
jgi:hypothetical protein